MVSMPELQQGAHDEGHDYAAGSPHIKHYAIRTMIVERLQCIIRDIADRKGSCRVLEVGAGHGTFTDHIVAAGAEVVVTEMSAPSAAELRHRFRHNRAVTVVDDPEGSIAPHGDAVDVVACMSVLHHIPDYMTAVNGMIGRVGSGGAFVSFQDPLWYPRRTRLSLRMERAAYLAWRVPRGDFIRGLSTMVRRARGFFDESNPSDMVEYHVVRQGVDDLALRAMLMARFASVELVSYWSTQAGWAQALGSHVFPANTFGLLATGAADSTNTARLNRP